MRTFQWIASLFAVFLLPFISIGQEQANPMNELDQKNTPPKGSFFGIPTESQAKKIKGEKGATMVFKFNPFLLPRGTVALFAEAKLAKRLSVQFGAGGNYTYDWIQYSSIMDGTMEFSATSAGIDLINLYNRSSGSTGTGLFLSAGFRLYPFGNATKGFFIEPGFRYSKVDLAMSKYYDEIEVKGSRLASIQQYNFQLLFGVQAQSRGKVKLTHEFYAGTGIRKTDYSDFRLVTEQIDFDETITYYKKTPFPANIYLPILLAGYVFGFGF